MPISNPKYNNCPNPGDRLYGKVNRSYIFQRAFQIKGGKYGMGGAGTGYTPKVAEGEYGSWVNEDNRWDCSGFVGYCIGAPKGSHQWSTVTLHTILPRKGFKRMGYNNGQLLLSYLIVKPGDILIYNDPTDPNGGAGARGHTEIVYDSNGNCFGARGPQDTPVGVSGYLKMYNSFSHGWTDWWRPSGGIAIEKWIPA